jgi:hypothetical protein
MTDQTANETLRAGGECSRCGRTVQAPLHSCHVTRTNYKVEPAQGEDEEPWEAPKMSTYEADDSCTICGGELAPDDHKTSEHGDGYAHDACIAERAETMDRAYEAVREVVVNARQGLGPDEALDEILGSLSRATGGPYNLASALFRLLDREEKDEETGRPRSLRVVSHGTDGQDAMIQRVAEGATSNANGMYQRLAAFLLEASDGKITLARRRWDGQRFNVEDDPGPGHRLKARIALGRAYVANVLGDLMEEGEEIPVGAASPRAVGDDGVIILYGDREAATVSVAADDEADAERRIIRTFGDDATIDDLDRAVETRP